MKRCLIITGLLAAMFLTVSGCGMNNSQEDAVKIEAEPVKIEAEPVEIEAEPVEIEAESVMEDAAKDSAEELLKLLFQNLGTEEFAAEGIAVLCDPEWSQTMLTEKEMVKRYCWDTEYASLYVHLEREHDGSVKTVLWYVEEEHVQVISHTDEMLQVMQCGFVDGKYQGDFESWRLLAASGSVYRETGVFRDGSYTEDCLVEAKEGQNQADIFSMWLGKELLELEKFEADVDKIGNILLCQPIFPGEDRFGKDSSLLKEAEIEYLMADRKQAQEMPKESESPSPVTTPAPTSRPQKPSSEAEEEIPTGQETEIEWNPDMM